MPLFFSIGSILWKAFYSDGICVVPRCYVSELGTNLKFLTIKVGSGGTLIVWRTCTRSSQKDSAFLWHCHITYVPNSCSWYTRLILLLNLTSTIGKEIWQIWSSFSEHVVESTSFFFFPRFTFNAFLSSPVFCFFSFLLSTFNVSVVMARSSAYSKSQRQLNSIELGSAQIPGEQELILLLF